MDEAASRYQPRPRRSVSAPTFVTVAVVAVVLALAVAGLLVWLSSSGAVKNQLGEATFPAGRAHRLAPEVAERGPLLYPDLLGRSRPIYLQHLSGDPAHDWVAIQAVPPGEARNCVVRWHAEDRLFHDPCSPATFPAGGDGLVRYRATVLPSDRISVDLHTALPADAATIAPPSSAGP